MIHHFCSNKKTFLFACALKQAEIKPMVNAGIRGFKCFLVHSGVDEFPSVTENDVRLAMQQMQGTDAVFLVCLIIYLYSFAKFHCRTLVMG